ncbi:MAG: 50S ribosomal protein L30e [Candidatus Diapherotrites archaeon]|nr:50S ribosomal protein L30e [Candidatus Diapherotrites archaeon]
MSDIDIIKRVLETGKVSLGTRSVEKVLGTKKPKLVIISKNCPKVAKENIVHRSKIAGVAVHEFSGTSLELGEICRKPFPVSAMAIMEPGQAEITKLRSTR